jgi:tetratricopeptide (TPR) repeat protein
VLSPGELLGRLGRRLALEGAARDLPERQRTLRATIDWSHQLLDVEEARLFAHLSVFAGGWTRQAAERVCGEGLRVQVLDGLESLVEHSLVQRVTSGDDALRFDMLETIREYARERLDASGAAADLARRHARYFLELAQDAEPHLTGPQADRWLESLRVETDNLRSALRWAMDRGDPPSVEIGLRMAASLWRFWQQTGALREARQWLEGLLARGTDASIRSARARALIAAGSIAYWQTDLGRAREHYQLAVEQYRTLGDRRGMADALSNLAPVPMMTGDLPLARRLAAQARDLWPLPAGPQELRRGASAGAGGKRFGVGDRRPWPAVQPGERRRRPRPRGAAVGRLRSDQAADRWGRPGRSHAGERPVRGCDPGDR